MSRRTLKMHQLGLREPQIEELDSDVLVKIRHESLASPEQTIKDVPRDERYDQEQESA
jgi:hypothetical protein